MTPIFPIFPVLLLFLISFAWLCLRPGIPGMSPDRRYARAIVRRGLKPVRRKAQVTLRIDAEVIDWFRARGRGYQTRINSILKAYRDAHRQRA